MRRWAMSHQALAFGVAVCVVLASWVLYLVFDQDFLGKAGTVVGVAMLGALFVWNGQRDPDRNQPKYGPWIGGGGS